MAAKVSDSMCVALPSGSVLRSTLFHRTTIQFDFAGVSVCFLYETMPGRTYWVPSGAIARDLDFTTMRREVFKHMSQQPLSSMGLYGHFTTKPTLLMGTPLQA